MTTASHSFCKEIKFIHKREILANKLVVYLLVEFAFKDIHLLLVIFIFSKDNRSFSTMICSIWLSVVSKS